MTNTVIILRNILRETLSKEVYQKEITLEGQRREGMSIMRRYMTLISKTCRIKPLKYNNKKNN